jgi:chorismate mutase/prephenate dehydrogenase
MVDALDRDLLQIAARRMALVAEIAAYKRMHGLRIRDPSESARCSTTARRAPRSSASRATRWSRSSASCCVRAGTTRRRSAPRCRRTRSRGRWRSWAGAGRIGRLLARLFGDLGHRVLIADVDTDLTPEAAAAAADVTVVSVPIDVTEAVIRTVGPHVRPTPSSWTSRA